MPPWNDVPVLSGVAYSWSIARNLVTSFYGGMIFIPADQEVPCDLCKVPHQNASTVFCYDPWSSKRIGPGAAGTPDRLPIICAECRGQLAGPR